jgi:hypothetical protein
MIAECFNPDCHKELRYLRDGRVVRIVRTDDDRISVEHFWLCGDCYRLYDFRFAVDGTVSLFRRIYNVPTAELLLDQTMIA